MSKDPGYSDSKTDVLGSRLRTTEDKLKRLKWHSQKLRDAQKAYMADRGNDTKGKLVADAAAELDLVLAEG